MEAVLTAATTSEVPLITTVVQHIIQKGGKRLRPLLTLLSAKLSGYTGEGPVRIGSAIEMIHTATLLHDDVVDNADLRRGNPSVKAKWGNQVSVLVGDFFWTKASEMIVQEGNLKILEIITRAIRLTTEAEVLEITKHNDFGIEEEIYLKIIRGKTALLFSACCQIGAVFGNVSEPFEEAMRRFGADLGMAFQLTDDLLDYESDEEKFGKQKGGDLKEGKLTLPLIVALKQANLEEQKLIKGALLSGRLESQQLKGVLALIHKYNGMEYTRRLATEYVQRAKENLAAFKPSLEKEALLGLTEHTLTRSE